MSAAAGAAAGGSASAAGAGSGMGKGHRDSSTRHTAIERVGQVLHLSEHGVGNHVIPLDASNGSFMWHAMAQGGDEAALRAFNGTRRGAGHVASVAAAKLAQSCGFQDSAAVAFGTNGDNGPGDPFWKTKVADHAAYCSTQLSGAHNDSWCAYCAKGTQRVQLGPAMAFVNSVNLPEPTHAGKDNCNYMWQHQAGPSRISSMRSTSGANPKIHLNNLVNGHLVTTLSLHCADWSTSMDQLVGPTKPLSGLSLFSNADGDTAQALTITKAVQKLEAEKLGRAELEAFVIHHLGCVHRDATSALQGMSLAVGRAVWQVV